MGEAMKVGFFSSTQYTKDFFAQYGKNFGFEMEFLEARLTPETVVLSAPYDAVCVFVNDVIDETVIKGLKRYDVGHIALRCVGFNNIDLAQARLKGISVSRVPDYSANAVAEFTVALILALNRKIHRAFNRVKEQNFSLQGLLGFNLHCKTVGIVGAGRIGLATMRILHGFGCKILCRDPTPNKEAIKYGAEYVDMDTLLHRSDIISLHCPLTEQSQHLIHHDSVRKMKDGVMLINTSRGALMHTQAILAGLKSGKIGSLGLDVYEKESELIHPTHSCETINQETFQRLASFPNVVVTGHQGYFTRETVQHIVLTTLENLQYYVAGIFKQETFL